jgi:hypothetical protein
MDVKRYERLFAVCDVIRGGADEYMRNKELEALPVNNNRGAAQHEPENSMFVQVCS